jgi:predicted dehydrogenase
MASESTGLVIGYGSIGRRHARTLAELGIPLVIVNRREAVRDQAAKDHPGARIVERIEELDGNGFRWEAAAAVIAAWGPSHAPFFHQLADRGVRRILCEKPMASSVFDAKCMADRAHRDGIALGLNHTLRYARLAPAIREVASLHALGEPVAVAMTGGAACLLTNGIHWIDFATELFGNAPLDVTSTGAGDPINPRSPDLMMYGGTAVWRFGGEREAVISFSNLSSVFPQARVYFRDALLEVGYIVGETDEYVQARVCRRDREALARYPAVTRTGRAVEPVFDGQLPGIRGFNEGLRAAAAELLDGRMTTCDAGVGVASVSTCIGALTSAKQRTRIPLPVEPLSPAGRESWPIS